RRPNTAVDVTSTIGIKVRTLALHDSKWPALARGRREIDGLHLRNLARTLGHMVGYRYAEFFRQSAMRAVPVDSQDASIDAPPDEHGAARRPANVIRRPQNAPPATR